VCNKASKNCGEAEDLSNTANTEGDESTKQSRNIIERYYRTTLTVHGFI
jgi:hypothetical protein